MLALILQMILLVAQIKDLNFDPLRKSAPRELVQYVTRAPNEDTRIPSISKVLPFENHFKILVYFLGTQTSVGLSRAMHRAIVLELKRFRIAVHLGKVLFVQGDPTRTGKTVYKRLGRGSFFTKQRENRTNEKRNLEKMDHSRI